MPIYKVPWITNKDPTYEDNYLVTVKGAVRASNLYFSDGKWTDDRNNEYEVIAWYPYPLAFTA